MMDIFSSLSMLTPPVAGLGPVGGVAKVNENKFKNPYGNDGDSDHEVPGTAAPQIKSGLDDIFASMRPPSSSKQSDN